MFRHQLALVRRQIYTDATKPDQGEGTTIKMEVKARLSASKDK